MGACWKVPSGHRVTLEQAKQEYIDGGCELLTDVFEGVHRKYPYLCNCGRVAEITLAHFREGKRCKDCAGNRKLTLETAREIYASRGCKLLSETYENVDEPMEYMCGCGEVHWRSLYLLRKHTYTCPSCAPNCERFTYEFVDGYFTQEGCTLISPHYKNNGELLEYICSCGNHSFTRFRDFARGHRCKKCGTEKAIEKMRGEKNYNWNHELTDEERFIQRKHPAYYKWRDDVFRRDDYTCQVCLRRGSIVLNAHHYENYAENRELRHDIDNGVTACESDHKEFHRIYGRKNNTRRQFEEYKHMRRQQLGIMPREEEVS